MLRADPLLRERLAAAELVVQIGAAPVSSAWHAAMEAHRGRRMVIAAHGWPDPASRAHMLVRADVTETLRAVGARIARVEGKSERSPCPLAVAFARAGDAAFRAVAAELERTGDVLSEGAVAREVVQCLPRGGMLAVGNSLPVRHLDRFCPGGAGDVLVLAQRGAAGIDGLISSAAGAASALGVPSALLLGDVSFLHDVGGLLAARTVETPLAVVVMNNDGGRIFEQLPIAKAPGLARHLPHFTTPHGLELAHAAALYGLPFARTDTVSGLRRALAEAMGCAGCTVVEARVPPHGAAEALRRIEAALAEAICE